MLFDLHTLLDYRTPEFSGRFHIQDTASIMSKSDFSQKLLASSSRPQTAAEKIPIIARFAVSERAKETLNLVRPHFSTSTIFQAHILYR